MQSLIRQIFELVLKRRLLRPSAGDTWSAEEYHLAQMIDTFGDLQREMIENAPHREKYFNENG